MILKVIVQFRFFFFFARGVHVCKHSHLRACEVVVPK